MLLIKLYLRGQGRRTNVWIRAQVLMDQSLWRRTSLPSSLLPSSKEQAAEGTQEVLGALHGAPATAEMELWSLQPQ